LGNYFEKLPSSGVSRRTPNLAGLKIVVFPMMSAGINKAKVSLSG